MDKIKHQCFQRMLQEAEKSKYDMGMINPAQESYWEDVKLDYGIEEYNIEDVHDLQEKIQGILGLSEECSKCTATIAVKEFLDNLNVKKDKEMQMAKLPEYVYRM